MAVLWEVGSATADEIREALPDDLHDSTVRTLLRLLEAKGYVSHTTNGRTFVYAPRVDRAKVQRKALRSLLHSFFGGSAEALVARLLEDEHISVEEIQRLRARLTPESRKRGVR